MPEHLCSQCCTETAIYCPAGAGIVEHVATFPNITVDSGQDYQACVITTKNLDLICKTGFFSCSKTGICRLSLNTANIAKESVEEEE